MMNPEKLPAFAKMILKRQGERNHSKGESSFISTLKSQQFEQNETEKRRNSKSEFVEDTQISKSQISDISFSVLDDDAQQIVELQNEISQLQRENRDLRAQNKALQKKIIECQDTSEIDSLSEELIEAKARLEEERAQRKIAEDNIVYLKNELNLKSKNVKANISIIESLQIKNMKLQELISSMKGEPIEQSNYSQMMESEQNSVISSRSSSSGTSRYSSARSSKRNSTQVKRPDEMTDAELDREIERVTASYCQISDELDDPNLDPQSDLRDQLESEFSVISKKLSQLKFEKKMRAQE